MREISITVSPGIVALFLLNTEFIPDQDDVERKQLIQIAAPLGMNHHNINVGIIAKRSSFDYSLIDIYSKDDFEGVLDSRMIMSIADNVTTPFVAVPFSIQSDSMKKDGEINEVLVNLVTNKSIKNFHTRTPKIIMSKKAKSKNIDGAVSRGK